MTPWYRRTSFWVQATVLTVGLALGYIVGGWHELLLVAALAVFEVALSFNNAIINATVLRQMNRFWQTVFLTVGLLIAVVGMRLLFPVLVVMVAAGLAPGEVVDLALHHPAAYAHHLASAHAVITAFGASFLFMLFLDFLLDETKRVHWVVVVEQPLARAGRHKILSTAITLILLVAAAVTLAGSERWRVLLAGLGGLGTYLAIRVLSQLIERWGRQAAPAAPVGGGRPVLHGWAAVGLFVYLEVLDAAFSFDGVVGAFAISENVVTIALGLGIGAFYVRELTLWLVRRNALAQFRYLEHGAQYSVGALAILMTLSLRYDIPDVVVGVVGVAFIGVALASSRGAQA